MLMREEIKRVVFIPGLMGSALGYPLPPRPPRPDAVEWFMSHQPIGGPILRAFDEPPHAIWGSQEMLWYPFLLQQDLLFERLTGTDGRTDPGLGYLPPGSVTDIFDAPLTRIVTHKERVFPYDKFLVELKRREYYLPLDLRIFCYDWRLSNSFSAAKLAQFIADQWGPLDSMKASERVTIVAHSMGGLVARCFIESPMFEGYRAVKQLLTVGTPHQGTPQIYSHLRGTSPSNTWLEEELLTRKHQQLLAFRLDSIAEMLPIYDFVYLHTGILERWRSTLSEIRLPRYPAENPRGTPTFTDALSVVTNFRAHLRETSELQAWLAWRRVKYVFLGGVGMSTVGPIVKTTGSPTIDMDGDSTVPYRSSTNFGGGSRPGPLAASTLREGMRRHPPLQNTEWLERSAISADGRYGGALSNRDSYPHDEAMKIDAVGASVAAHIGETDIEAGPPTFNELFRFGHRVAASLRKGISPQVLCAARFTLGDSRPPAPPLTYSPAHPLAGYRRPFPLNSAWRDSEIIEERFPNTFPDIFVGGQRTVRSPPQRFLLMDMQAESDSFHPAGGAILMDEWSADNEIYVVTWNTGEMYPSSRTKGNKHHAEDHLAEWWSGVDLAERVKRIDVCLTLSPCTSCCGSLISILDASWRRGRRSVEANISWLGIYEGSKKNGYLNRTKRSDIAAMARAGKGWKVVERSDIVPPFTSPLPRRGSD